MKYLCHVCGYPDLDEPPYDPVTGSASFDICPCCGCEFGYSDPKPASNKPFLREWIRFGTPWHEPGSKPLHWDAKQQLKGINVDYDQLLRDIP